MKRMPVIFSGHGSPMLALENNEITKKLADIGMRVKSPKAVLSISAHWYTNGTFTQNVKKPRQVYDMYGFPQELYDVNYPVNGCCDLTSEIVNVLGSDVEINNDWGIDHGTWTVLVHMFPEANIPVVQLSVNAQLSAEECFSIGEKLAVLRDKNYLILASGNIVHNLGAVEWDNPDGSGKTHEFNDYVIHCVCDKNYENLINFRDIKDSNYACPTPEHYLPFLYALGASDGDDAEIFNNKCELASISMTGFAFGLD